MFLSKRRSGEYSYFRAPTPSPNRHLHKKCAAVGNFTLDLHKDCANNAYMNATKPPEDADSAEPKRIWTSDELAIFAALAIGETVASAAAKGGLAERTYYDHKKADPEFAARCDQARREGDSKRADELESVLHTGAGLAATDPRYTTQLIFALKNLRPVKWRDSHEISGPGGGAIPMQIVMFGEVCAHREAQPDELEQEPGDSATGA